MPKDTKYVRDSSHKILMYVPFKQFTRTFNGHTSLLVETAEMIQDTTRENLLTFLTGSKISYMLDLMYRRNPVLYSKLHDAGIVKKLLKIAKFKLTHENKKMYRRRGWWY